MSLGDYTRKKSPLGPEGKGERKRRSKKQEDRVAATMGGRRQPASGAMMSQKGDVKTAFHTVECKQRTGSIRITPELLGKVEAEAAAQSRTPALVLEFLDRQPGMEREWVMVPLSEAVKWLKAYEGERDDERATWFERGASGVADPADGGGEGA